MEWTGIGVLLGHFYELYEKWIELPAFLRWVGTALIFIFIEIQRPRLFLLWFALASFATIPVAALFPDHLIIQVFGFVIFSYAFFYYRRSIIALLSPVDRLGFFADALIGGKAVCVSAIDGWNAAGEVKTAGSVWPALCVSGSKVSGGERLRIVGRRDHQLFVRPQTEAKSGESGPLKKLVGRLGVLELKDQGEPVFRIGSRFFPAQGFPAGVQLSPGAPVKVIAGLGDRLLVELARETFVRPGDIIGKTGVIDEQVGGRKRFGTVKIDGIGWRAYTDEKDMIKRGQLVQIVGIDGVILVVKALEVSKE